MSFVDISNFLRGTLVIAALAVIACGLAYPVAVTAVAGTTFPFQAGGEQVIVNGTVVGSYLIAQNFSAPVFFHPHSGSASGEDPAITIEDAYAQVPGVSSMTGIPQSALYMAVNESSSYTVFFFDQQYVNVVGLNMYLITHYPSVYSGYLSRK